MAQLTSKTPLDGKLWIKPKLLADSATNTYTLNPKAEGPNYVPYGGRRIKNRRYYGDNAEWKGQMFANQYNRPTYYRGESYFGPTRTSLYPGKSGIKLPEQWKYKPEKTGSALADSMMKDANL